MKLILRIVLAVFMIFAGFLHFKKPDVYVKIMPSYLPFPLELVYISGFFEILGGIGLLIPSVSKAAAWGLILLFISVFPANLNMAVHNIPFGDGPTHPLFLWLRLPLQLVLILWAWWFTR